MRLTHEEIKAFLNCLRQIYAELDLEAFQRRVISELPKLVASEITSYNEVNPRRRRHSCVMEPSDASFPGGERIFDQFIPEHPLITHYHKTYDGRALKISDFLTPRQFHCLGLYNEFYRRMSVEHQIAVTLPAPPSVVIGIALNRDRQDFSDRDRLILNLLRPHLIQAYRNAEAVTQLRDELAVVKQTVERLDQGIITLKRDGSIRLVTPRARKWVADYFGHQSLTANLLPEALQRWVRQQESLLADKEDVPPPCQPLIVEQEGRRLIVRLIPNPGQTLLLLEERHTALQAASLEVFGLTRRESEVLFWVTRGKTNAEIGSILSASRRTVEKHLERIYQKFGVETRTAAMARALELLSGSCR